MWLLAVSVSVISPALLFTLWFGLAGAGVELVGTWVKKQIFWNLLEAAAAAARMDPVSNFKPRGQFVMWLKEGRREV